MNQHPRHMKISELSAFSGTPVTTIRYYILEGLLPEPLRTAKTMAYYTEKHLNRILEIQKLKKEKVPLAIIKKKLADDANKSSVLSENNDELLTSTRDEIIRISVQLFRQQGYDAVKISDIASNACIGKGTFYQYFKNKEELFFECLANIFLDVGKDVPEIQEETDALRRLRKRGFHFYQNFVHMIDMLNIARRASLINKPEYKEKLEKAIFNFIEPIRKEIEIILEQRNSPLKNSTLVAYLLMGAAEYTFYFLLNYKKAPEEIEKEFLNFFFGSVSFQEGWLGK
ncbi:MAG TPA: TetR family transcriptional regulator [Bacteroidales bacterium]|nr:TetR family transcriptional regulator [Bacteroidales bacterium]